MSAPHVFAVGDRATVVSVDYDFDTCTHREIVLAIGVVEHAKGRIRLDTGAQFARKAERIYRLAGWYGYGGTNGRLRPYQPGDEERLAERRAEEALDDAKRRRKTIGYNVDAAKKDVERAYKHLDAMESDARQAQADVAAAEARLAEARVAVAAIGGAS